MAGSSSDCRIKWFESGLLRGPFPLSFDVCLNCGRSIPAPFLGVDLRAQEAMRRRNSKLKVTRSADQSWVSMMYDGKRSILTFGGRNVNG
jgi:hypothetical protein